MIPYFGWEQDMLRFIEYCDEDQLCEAFELAVKNGWPYAFMATINRMTANNIDPSELVRQVLKDASYGRFALRGFRN